MSKVLHIVDRAGKPFLDVSVTDNTTIAEVKKQVEARFPKYYPDRQRLYALEGQSKVNLSDDKPLKHYQIFAHGNDQIYFTDLGPQIGWQTVFLIEYAGPIVIYLLFYLRPAFLYGPLASQPRSPVQNIAAACWLGHYLKRELETLFVHRFSHGTMPLLNVFKNSSYYWGAGAVVGYFVNHPLFTDPPMSQVYASLAFFVIFELCNGYCHIILRNLRPPGTRERRIPRGFLFEYVSCPNYTFEIFAWLAFSVMTQTLPAFGFTLIGAVQMILWAQGKHKKYREEFDKYPKNRKIIFPFIY